MNDEIIDLFYTWKSNLLNYISWLILGGFSLILTFYDKFREHGCLFKTMLFFFSASLLLLLFAKYMLIVEARTEIAQELTRKPDTITRFIIKMGDLISTISILVAILFFFVSFYSGIWIMIDNWFLWLLLLLVGVVIFFIALRLEYSVYQD